MKKYIHPKLNLITVKMTNGETFQVKTTWGKQDGDLMSLDIDPSSHPAWVGGQQAIAKGGKIDKFKERYGSFKVGK